jgi:predicted transposase YbfD/YdcC
LGLYALSSDTSFAQAVRGHWGIKNELHWVLDVVFRENASRVRLEHSGPRQDQAQPPFICRHY